MDEQRGFWDLRNLGCQKLRTVKQSRGWKFCFALPLNLDFLVALYKLRAPKALALILALCSCRCYCHSSLLLCLGFLCLFQQEASCSCFPVQLSYLVFDFRGRLGKLSNCLCVECRRLPVAIHSVRAAGRFRRFSSCVCPFLRWMLHGIGQVHPKAEVLGVWAVYKPGPQTDRQNKLQSFWDNDKYDKYIN